MKFKPSDVKKVAEIILCVGAMLLLTLTLLSLGTDESPLYLFVDRHRFDAEITRAAAKHRLDPALMRALILRESRFNPYAVGSKGELGLMQLMPGNSGAVAEWARVCGKPKPQKFELFNVELNLEIGAWYLKRMLNHWRKYRCAEELALAEYNAELSRVKRWKPENPDGEVISRITLPETKRYVTFIMRHYRKEVGK